jgi:hypothetical protein
LLFAFFLIAFSQGIKCSVGLTCNRADEGAVTYSSIVDEPTHVYREVRQCKHYVNQHVRDYGVLTGGKAPSSHTQTARSIQTPPRCFSHAIPGGANMLQQEAPGLDRKGSQHRKILHHDLPVQLNPLASLRRKIALLLTMTGL